MDEHEEFDDEALDCCGLMDDGTCALLGTEQCDCCPNYPLASSDKRPSSNPGPHEE